MNSRGRWNALRDKWASLTQWLPFLVARIPATIYAKLLTAFLVIVALLITVGTVGLQSLNESNRRDAQLIALDRKLAAYRQIQNDTNVQLYNVTSALLSPDEKTLDTALRQLNLFSYDLERLQFVAPDETDLLTQIETDHKQFINVMTQVIALTRAGKVTEAHDLQLEQAGPLADSLERLTNQLVNRAEADIVTQVDQNRKAYINSLWVIIGFAAGSITVALALGYAISLSLILPIRQMDIRLKKIASGDFSGIVEVPNRDELRTLASNLNHMNAELGRLYAELAGLNRSLETRVQQQVGELERLSRLRRFLAPQLAEAIISSGGETLLVSHRREIAVVFCDLRGFTAFSEIAEPEEVMGMLQEYHQAMGVLIHRFEGTIEHFSGDGLMIFFNDQLPCSDPAARAARMAVAMRQRMSEVTAGWQKRGHELGFGVGIALGYATLGQIGFEGRFDYGAVGTVVNLAARLCAEAHTGQLLITQRIYTAIGDLVEAESVGELTLKGLSKPVPAFNIVGLKETV